MLLSTTHTRASGSSTGNFSVSTTVNQICRATSPTLDFGTYYPITANAATPLDSSTTITITCAFDQSLTLGFDQGANALASHCGASPQRCMSNGSNYLNYNIYATTSDRSSGSPWISPVPETISGGSATVSIYGRVPAGQDVSVGSYSDSIVATVYY
jgi:spore coat protein U-like protein